MSSAPRPRRSDDSPAKQPTRGPEVIPGGAEAASSFDRLIHQPVRLAIYDGVGRLVRTLASGSLPAGRHERVWNGVDDAGRGVASGVYHYRLTGEGLDQVRRMTLIK